MKIKLTERFDNYYRKLVEDLYKVTEEDIYNDLESDNKKFIWKFGKEEVLNRLRDIFSGDMLSKGYPAKEYEPAESPEYDIPYDFEVEYQDAYIELFLKYNNLKKSDIEPGAMYNIKEQAAEDYIENVNINYPPDINEIYKLFNVNNKKYTTDDYLNDKW